MSGWRESSVETRSDKKGTTFRMTSPYDPDIEINVRICADGDLRFRIIGDNFALKWLSMKDNEEMTNTIVGLTPMEYVEEDKV